MNIEPVSRFGDMCPSSLNDELKDENTDSLQIKQYSVVGASVRGKLHARSENHNHRDDAFAVYQSNDWLVIAVSDGAGSRELSRYGAAYAVNSFCSAIMDITSRDGFILQDGLKEIVLQAFKDTRTYIDQFCSQHGVKPEDLHCTLLGLVLNTATENACVGQIGDGLISGLNDKGEASSLVDPPSPGEVGVSYFLTQSDWGKYLSIKEIAKGEVASLSTFYLMSDGVADDCQYGPPADILTLWAKDIDREIRASSITSLEEAENDLKAFLNSYQAQGSFDDRTLVIGYRTKKVE